MENPKMNKPYWSVVYLFVQRFSKEQIHIRECRVKQFDNPIDAMEFYIKKVKWLRQLKENYPELFDFVWEFDVEMTEALCDYLYEKGINRWAIHLLEWQALETKDPKQPKEYHVVALYGPWRTFSVRAESMLEGVEE